MLRKKKNLSKLIQYQILSITCDNATSNDKMIDELAGQLEEFPGAPNCARCFTHVLNLMVKSIMHQFDVPKKRWDVMDETTHDLFKLAGNIEEEKLEMQIEQEDSQEEPEEGPRLDNDEGWVDEQVGMAEEDMNELEDSVRPIQFVLTKVSSASQYYIVLANQSTHLRFANLHMQSRTRPRLPSLSGITFLRPFCLRHK